MAIEDAKPKFRYFTSKKAEEFFAKQLVDPSGEEWLQNDKNLAIEWFKKC